ncbi:MAG TPA: hypothetical protein VEL74_13445 [Thermoanaerobaculia bacterium]|nr:hypothetical protein [Thermoanaerobaculia bacterium]
MSRQSGGLGPLARLLRPFLGGKGGNPWPPFWVLRQEVPLAGAEQELEAATAEIMGEVQRRKPASGTFHVTTLRLDGGDHLFLMPLRGPAGLADLMSEWNRLAMEVGASRWGEMAARGNRAMETFSLRVFMEPPGLGWRPEGAPGLGDRSGAFLFDFFHLRPVAEQQFGPVVRELATVCRDRVPGGFTVLLCTAGAELPLVVLVWTAPDAAELQRREEALAAAGGAAILERLEGLARRRERRRGELRPQLSHLP